MQHDENEHVNGKLVWYFHESLSVVKAKSISHLIHRSPSMTEQNCQCISPSSGQSNLHLKSMWDGATSIHLFPS